MSNHILPKTIQRIGQEETRWRRKHRSDDLFVHINNHLEPSFCRLPVSQLVHSVTVASPKEKGERGIAKKSAIEFQGRAITTTRNNIMCTSYVLLILLTTVLLLDARDSVCVGGYSENFRDRMKRLHNKIRERGRLPPLSYSCKLEKLAIAAVMGCQPMPPKTTEAVHIIFRNYMRDQGSTNISHTSIVAGMILDWVNNNKSRYEMERSDIGSVGCGAAKCPESSGPVNISVACFYGNVSDISEMDSPTATTIPTPNEEEEEEESSTKIPSINEPLTTRSPKDQAKSKDEDMTEKSVAAPRSNGHFSFLIIPFLMLELQHGVFRF
uniref:SCP domain-containing protein n=1 Tax=Angiostrongylus cantonensis TaxID=6313 RepID=A0A158PCQ4_ANGCA